jgi:O-antigen ligase
MATETTPEPTESAWLRASRFALALTLASLPSYVLRFQVGPFPSTTLEILVVLTVGLYVVGAWREGRRLPVRTPLDLPIVVFLVAGLIGVVIPSDHVAAAGHYRAYFIEPVVLFYIAVDLLRTPRDLWTVLVGFGAGSTIFAVLNLGAWAIALAHQSVNIRSAPEAIYTSPNAVAMYMEPPTALALGLVLYAPSARIRKLALGWLAVLVVASILTLSRGLYVAFGAAIIFAVFSLTSVRIRLTLIGAAILAVITMLQVPYISVRILGQHGPETVINSLEQRLSIWTSTFHLIRDHPIFGVGLRAYQKAIVPYVLPDEIPELYPHNIYLAFWAQLGLVGLLSFIYLFVSMVVIAWRAFLRAAGLEKALLWGVLAALIMFAVHGVADTPYFKNDLSIEFWMLAAFEVAAIRFLAAHRAPQEGRAPATAKTTAAARREPAV